MIQVLNEQVHIKDNGLLTINLKAVEAGGNDPIVKDWHAVNFNVLYSRPTLTGAVPMAYTIDNSNHQKLKVNGGFVAGDGILQISGVVGNTSFAANFYIQCDASGSASVTKDLVLKTLCVAEDGGVESIGGKSGAITLGEHLVMNNKQLNVSLPVDLVIDLSEQQGVTDMTTAINYMQGMSIHEAFGTSVELADIDAAFYNGKGVIVIIGSRSYVFNRLFAVSTTGSAEYRFMFTDPEMTTHEMQVTATGLAFDNGILVVEDSEDVSDFPSE